MKVGHMLVLLAAALCNPTLGQDTPDGVEGAWFVQVGSYSSQGNANYALQNVVGMGLPAALETVPVGTTVWYRMRVGPYQAEGVAQATLERIRANGYATAKLVRGETDVTDDASGQRYRAAFERATKEGSVASYETFVNRYCGNDPDGLVPLAIQQARAMRHQADRKVWLESLPTMIDSCQNVERQLAHERKVGEASGFVDKELMHRLGRQKVTCDENIVNWRKNYKLLSSSSDASSFLDQFVPELCPASRKSSHPRQPYNLRTNFQRLEEGVKAFFRIQKEGGSSGVWETLQTGYAEFEKKPDPAQFQYLAALDLANYRWADHFKDNHPVIYTGYPDEAKSIDLVRERLVRHCSRLVADRNEADEILVSWLPKVELAMDTYIKAQLKK